MKCIKKVLCIQSVGDLITNSSSEVWITTSMPAIPKGESWANIIDLDFMLKRNEDDAYCVWEFLEDRYGLKNPIAGHYVDPDKPDELEFVWSSSMEWFTKKFGERKTNRHYMEVFNKYAEEHQELKDLLDGKHYVVSISDHDEDYMDYPVDGEFVFGH